GSNTTPAARPVFLYLLNFCGMPLKSVAPERLGREQFVEVLAQFRFVFIEPVLVPAEHLPPGLGNGAGSVSGRCELGEDLMPDAQIVGVAEIVLQALQALDEGGGLFRRVKAGER